jgi:hypothetical protein
MSPNSRVLGERAPIPWPLLAWLLPVWFLYLGFSWWEVGRLQIAEQIDGAASRAGGLAALTVAGRLVGWSLETAFYFSWWRWRGRALPFGRLFAWIASLSIADLWSESIRRMVAASAAEANVAWAVLVGPGVMGNEAGSSWSAAFGAAGLLTAARIVGTAQVQARALCLSSGGPLLLVTGGWLLGRLAIAFAVDLARGRSLSG